MRKGTLFGCFIACICSVSRAAYLHNDYSYLQEITFELYTDDVPAYKVPEQIKSIEESLMFEVLHATWKEKHWVAYTLNKSLLGTFKVGQPALLDNGDIKRMYFVAAFPGSVGGLDLYVSEYSKSNGWSKPKNLGKGVNTEKNESNPGLLNDHTLTYSSGGIIKKLDLNSFTVVDLEELSTAPAAKPVAANDPLAPLSAPAPASTAAQNTPAAPVQTAPVQQTPPVYTASASTPVAEASTSTASSVEMLGNRSREEMLSRYGTAIQLGAFASPKWEVLGQMAKYGKLVSYKNEKNMNVVWITGFSGRANAESVLQQVKAVSGFENAYVTGK
jgi:hypothetical protein